MGRYLAACLAAALAGCASGSEGGSREDHRGEETALRSASPQVEAEIEKAIADRAFPGASIAIGTANRVLYLRGFGHLAYEDGSPPVTPDTIYDLASLTKVVATTSAAMLLLRDGRIALDDRVGRWIREARGRPVAGARIRDLLTHRAGLPAWLPLYREMPEGAGRGPFIERILEEPLVAPPGRETVYSDLGMILLGEVLARAAGEDLDAFIAPRLFRPLGLRDTMFRPPPELRARIAPTEDDVRWRRRIVRGEVHDENAFALGGVAGHAGLFSTARDLARFAGALLAARAGEPSPFPVPPYVVRTFTSRAERGATRALGWDLASEGGSCGSLMSPSAFGHTGFTGTSIWIDPELRLFVILLTNRVHPTRENLKIRAVRRQVHDAAVRDWRDRIPRAAR